MDEGGYIRFIDVKRGMTGGFHGREREKGKWKCTRRKRYLGRERQFIMVVVAEERKKVSKLGESYEFEEPKRKTPNPAKNTTLSKFSTVHNPCLYFTLWISSPTSLPHPWNHSRRSSPSTSPWTQHPSSPHRCRKLKVRVCLQHVSLHRPPIRGTAHAYT